MDCISPLRSRDSAELRIVLHQTRSTLLSDMEAMALMLRQDRPSPPDKASCY
nr:MAG TPA: hypothetical protein [Caudoviricetes sp.]